MAANMFLSNNKYNWRCHICELTLCCIGICISIYAYYVETRKEQESDFRAACDISESVSCSKVFTSRYGRGFGLLDYFVNKNHWMNQPNSVFGIIFYLLLITLGQFQTERTLLIQLFLTIVANLASIYLSCILYFVLHDLCIICTTSYVINFLILICIIFSKRNLNRCKASTSSRAKMKNRSLAKKAD